MTPVTSSSSDIMKPLPSEDEKYMKLFFPGFPKFEVRRHCNALQHVLIPRQLHLMTWWLHFIKTEFEAMNKLWIIFKLNVIHFNTTYPTLYSWISPHYQFVCRSCRSPWRRFPSGSCWAERWRSSSASSWPAWPATCRPESFHLHALIVDCEQVTFHVSPCLNSQLFAWQST